MKPDGTGVTRLTTHPALDEQPARAHRCDDREAMKAVVVFDSQYGNTERIARAIAEELERVGTVLPVSAQDVLEGRLDLESEPVDSACAGRARACSSTRRASS